MNKRIQVTAMVLTLLVTTGFTPLPGPDQPRHDGETVILLHGIFNRPFIMKRIEWALERDGYQVINWGYPSRLHTIEEHAANLDRFVKTIDQNQTIHFVGFSLGSIVIRYYLTHYETPNAGRFVMIAPPNHGTEKVDYLYPFWWFRALYGTTSIRQLKASNYEFFQQLEAPVVEFGIIAGGLGNDSGWSTVLPGDDDGAVSTQSAKLAGATDFILLRNQHTTLLWRQETTEQVVTFLNSGRFAHSDGR